MSTVFLHGSGGGGVDVSGVTATPTDVRSGKTFVDKNGEEQGGSLQDRTASDVSIDFTFNSINVPGGIYSPSVRSFKNPYTAQNKAEIEIDGSPSSPDGADWIISFPNLSPIDNIEEILALGIYAAGLGSKKRYYIFWDGERITVYEDGYANTFNFRLAGRQIFVSGVNYNPGGKVTPQRTSACLKVR